MFVDKVKKSEIKNSNSKKFPLSGIFNVQILDVNFDILTIESDDNSITDRYWNKNYRDITLKTAGVILF